MTEAVEMTTTLFIQRQMRPHGTGAKSSGDWSRTQSTLHLWLYMSFYVYMFLDALTIAQYDGH